jgi:arginyl-tRNA--protein-N-Asp/Glu arginylyltransferase
MWLLDVLGGVPKPHYDYLHGLLHSERKDFDALCHDYNEEIENYRTAVQEICRRSNNTYYDWCCDQCACDCDKRNGWCNDFEPVRYGK